MFIMIDRVYTGAAVTNTAIGVIPSSLTAAGTPVLHSMESRVTVAGQTLVWPGAGAMPTRAVTWLTGFL